VDGNVMLHEAVAERRWDYLPLERREIAERRLWLCFAAAVETLGRGSSAKQGNSLSECFTKRQLLDLILVYFRHEASRKALKQQDVSRSLSRWVALAELCQSWGQYKTAQHFVGLIQTQLLEEEKSPTEDQLSKEESLTEDHVRSSLSRLVHVCVDIARNGDPNCSGLAFRCWKLLHKQLSSPTNISPMPESPQKRSLAHRSLKNEVRHQKIFSVRLNKLLGELEVAISLSKALVQELGDNIGLGHDLTLIALRDLVDLSSAAAAFETTLPLARRCLLSHESVYGLEHPLTMAASETLGSILIDGGRCEEAERLFEGLMELKQNRFGRDHPISHASGAKLAVAKDIQERYGESEKLFNEAIAAMERMFGTSDRDTAKLKFNRATSYMRQENFNRAVTDYKDEMV
jgi:tetratricopeptide repeat protein